MEFLIYASSYWDVGPFREAKVFLTIERPDGFVASSSVLLETILMGLVKMSSIIRCVVTRCLDGSFLHVTYLLISYRTSIMVLRR